MAIKGLIRDVTSVTRIMHTREKIHNNASEEPNYNDHIGDIARSLHPGKITIKLIDIKTNNDYKTLTFTGDKIPYFKPGQYLTLEYLYEGYTITRPYYIQSSPKKALGDNKEISITISSKYSQSTKYLYDNAKIGDEYIAEVGIGFFTFDSIRDSHKIIGITNDILLSPFNSMIEASKDNIIDCDIKVIDENEILNNLSNDYSYFISGDSEFVNKIVKELSDNNIQKRRIRFSKNNSIIDKDVINNTQLYDIEVIRGIDSTLIKAKGNESIAQALEKNNIKIHTCCRNGICGNCRIQVLDGEYYVPSDNENRRKMDIEYGYVYSCHTYPKGNMKIKINI